MINIVLFNDESVIRIAERAKDYFSEFDGFRIRDDIIWLKGFYLKFSPTIITVNTINSNFCFNNSIYEGFKYILYGEEVYLSNSKLEGEYIKKVNSSTLFDSLFTY